MKVLTPFLLLILAFSSFSQDSDTTICEFPDKEAQFPGGVLELKKYLVENINYLDYSEALLNSKLYIQFVVAKDGSVSTISVLQDLPVDFEEDVKTLIEEMPKWSPARLNGKPVRSKVRIPIIIHLN